MARKTKKEALATREGILDAALACFHEYGVACTSLAVIGERAGYSRGAVYWHFKNKSEVLEAMVNRERVPYMERLRQTYSSQRRTPVVDLRSALLLSFNELAANARLRNMVQIMLRNDLSKESGAMQEMQKQHLHEQMDIYRHVFRRADELGQLRNHVDVDTVALALHTGLTGVLYCAMIEPELFDISRDSQNIVDAVLAAHVKEGVFTPGALPQPLPGNDAAGTD